MTRVLAVGAILLIALSVTGADTTPVPDSVQSRVELPGIPVMTTCPAGDGPPLQHITVYAKRADGSPIAGIASPDFHFDVDGNVTITAVDEETDEAQAEGQRRAIGGRNAGDEHDPPDVRHGVAEDPLDRLNRLPRNLGIGAHVLRLDW